MTCRYVLTGAPGAGKSVLLRELAERGWPVVAEAATDVIADRQSEGVDQPWGEHDFCDRIAALQRQRQQVASAQPAVQVYDRSPLCTLALARHLHQPLGPVLRAEVDRVLAEQVYQPSVFLVGPLGFITPTAARRITYAEALAFHDVHQVVYREYGFTLIEVPAGSPASRADLVETTISAPTST